MDGLAPCVSVDENVSDCDDVGVSAALLLHELEEVSESLRVGEDVLVRDAVRVAALDCVTAAVDDSDMAVARPRRATTSSTRRAADCDTCAAGGCGRGRARLSQCEHCPRPCPTPTTSLTFKKFSRAMRELSANQAR